MRALLEKFHKRADFAVVVPKELLRQAAMMRAMFNVLLVLIAGISLLVGGIEMRQNPVGFVAGVLAHLGCALGLVMVAAVTHAPGAGAVGESAGAEQARQGRENRGRT